MSQCNAPTKTGSPCQWPAIECPYGAHMRWREKQVERAYLDANPIAACNESCAESSAPAAQCHCACGGVNHGRDILQPRDWNRQIQQQDLRTPKLSQPRKRHRGRHKPRSRYQPLKGILF